jgi:hypothetical protein
LVAASACSSSSGNSAAGSCDAAWSKAVAACPAANSMQQQQAFLSLCNNPSNLAPSCPTQASAFADCIKGASTFMCDSSGQPHAVGCDAQTSAVATCAAGGAGDAALTSD